MESYTNSLVQQLSNLALDNEIPDTDPDILAMTRNNISITQEDFDTMEHMTNTVFEDDDEQVITIDGYKSVEEAVIRQPKAAFQPPSDIKGLSIEAVAYILLSFHKHNKTLQNRIFDSFSEAECIDAYKNLLSMWIVGPYHEKESLSFAYSIHNILNRYVIFLCEYTSLVSGNSNNSNNCDSMNDAHIITQSIIKYLLMRHRSPKAKELIDNFSQKAEDCNRIWSKISIHSPDFEEWRRISEKINNTQVTISSGRETKFDLSIISFDEVVETLLLIDNGKKQTYKILVLHERDNNISGSIYNGYQIQEFVNKIKKENDYMMKLYNDDHSEFRILSIKIRPCSFQFGSGKEYTEMIIINDNTLCMVYFTHTYSNCVPVSAILSQDPFASVRKHPLYKSTTTIEDIERYFKKKVVVYNHNKLNTPFDTNNINLFHHNAHIGYILPIDISQLQSHIPRPIEKHRTLNQGRIHALVFWDLEFGWEKRSTNRKKIEKYDAEAPNLISAVIYDDSGVFKKHLFESIRQFVLYIKCLSSHGPIYCYSHNGKKVEHLFLVEALISQLGWGSKQKFIKLTNMADNSIKSFRYENIYFFDSSLILPLSLEELTKVFNTNCTKDHEDFASYRDSILPLLEDKDELVKINDQQSIGNLLHFDTYYYQVLTDDTHPFHKYTLLLNLEETENFKQRLEKRVKERNIETLKSNWYLKKKWDKNNEKDRKYVHGDTFNLASAMMQFNETAAVNLNLQYYEIGNIKWYLIKSLSSLGKDTILQAHPEIQISPKFVSFFENSNRGGLMNALAGRYVTDSNKIVIKMDINSSYPHQVTSFPIPEQIIHISDKFEEEFKDYIWSAWCTIEFSDELAEKFDKFSKLYHKKISPITRPDGYPFINIENKNLLVHIWSFEAEKYKFKKINPSIVFYFSSTTLRNPLGTWYERKKNSSGPNRLLYKSLLNSSLGSLGLKTIRDTTFFINKGTTKMDDIIAKSNNLTIRPGPGTTTIVKSSGPITQNRVAHQVTSYMTARARMQLIDMILTVSEMENNYSCVVYDDTDAVILYVTYKTANYLKTISSNNELGAWDYEEYKYAFISGNKKYQLDDQIVHAGYPKNTLPEIWTKSGFGTWTTKWMVDKCHPNLSANCLFTTFYH